MPVPTHPADMLNAFQLANMADCCSPDSHTSPGAELLLYVQRATADHLAEGGDPEELHEIADGAPNVYTYQRWLQFTDLAAWQEEPEELGGTGEDMTTQAGICLYLIADRLAHALVNAWKDDADDSE